MKKQYILKTAIGFFAAGFYISGIHTASARWATPNDAIQEVNYQTCHIYVNKDCSSTSITELECIILKEHAKNRWANYAIEYNPKTSTCKILDAKTIVNNKTYKVDPKQIQEKPITSNQLGFDENNRITISYPNVDLNTTVFLKTESTDQPSMSNLYYDVLSFNHSDYAKSQKIHIVSEIPLYIDKNDPNQLIEILQSTKQDKNKTLYLIDIKQKKPFIQTIINEDNPILNPKHLPFVSISSVKNWPDFGKPFAIEYEKIRQEPLPSLYQEIANAAKTKATVIEKINVITSMLSEKITYLQNSRTMQGRFIPQSLQKVSDTHLGDCKDFSMATSVILQAIGIPSKIAFVKRGEIEQMFPLTLPNFYFNHAILKVELPNETLWVDPTNFHSMLSPVFPDIANKPALVLDINNPHLEMIPAIDAESNVFKVEETWHMKDDILQINGNVKFSGAFSKNFTGLQKKLSDESIKNVLVRFLNRNYGRILDEKIVMPNLSSTIVEDLSFDYALQSRNLGLQTNAGIAMPFQFPYFTCLEAKKGTVSDLYLGPPHIIDIVSTIEDIKPNGRKLLDCHIESPWADFTRTVRYEKNNMIIHQMMKLKKSWVEGTELESKEYRKLQLALNKHFNNGIAIIFDPKLISSQ